MAEKEFKRAWFVAVTLTDKDRASIKAWAKTTAEVSDMMHKIIEAGYKLTFSYDERNEAHVVWMTPTNAKHENNGLILSGRGRNPVNALYQALWLHFIKYKGVWPRPDGQVKLTTWDDD